MIDLKGKRALVTGGSRGIGAATALLLAECGANVGIGYRNREKDAEEVVRTIASLGVRGFAHAADISTVPARSRCSRAPRASSADSIYSSATPASGPSMIFRSARWTTTDGTRPCA
jgi:Dehydrogenases with different specificities (related to short-chain alcohol dehydrogenases)